MDDDFPVVEQPTIVGVKDLVYEIFDPDPDGNETQAMRYTAQLVWSNDNVTQQSGDVVPHLTAAEVTGLQALAARLRAKAETAWGNV